MHSCSCSGIAELLQVLESHAFLPRRHPEKPVVFSVDHCFSIKGQGTVLTGTIWQGTIKINDVNEFVHHFNYMILIHSFTK